MRGGHYESGIWVVDYPRMNRENRYQSIIIIMI